MSIKRLQQRLTQVGVIRLGEKVATGEKDRNGNPKMRPAKLATFRVTSPSRPLIEAVAQLLGGEVRPWQAKTGPEWEVITNATEIPVHVPPQAIDPNYELWGNGFRARLCDGETEKIRQAPCLCEAAARERYAQTKRAWPEGGDFERTRDDCKPTTRITLMISDIPAGIGTFKLESHGLNAASELPALSSAIAAAPQPIPAILRLQQREGGVMKIVDGREKVEARKYAVPVLDFFGLFTPRQAFSGELGSAIRDAIGGAQRQAIGSAAVPAQPTPPAVESGRRKLTEADVIRQIPLAKNVQQLQQLWRDAAADGALTERAKAELTNASDVLTKPAAPAVPVAEQPPVGEVVDAEPEPDADAVWQQIVTEAGKRKWDMPTLEAKFGDHVGVISSEADGWKLAAFLDALKSGAVQ